MNQPLTFAKLNFYFAIFRLKTIYSNLQLNIINKGI